MKASALSVLDNGGSASIAPEIMGAIMGNRIISGNAMHRFASDSYAIAALVVKILTWHLAGPMMQQISDVGDDWMINALYEDPKWRMYGHSALKHAWLSQC